MLDEKNSLVYLAAFPRFGTVRLEKIKKYFGSWKAACVGLQKDFEIALENQKLAQDFFEWRAKFNFSALLDNISKENIFVVTIEDNEYPVALKNIYDPPFVLYVRGDTDVFKAPLISVIGSRKFSSYGKAAAEKVSSELASNGVGVVSGLALGIDALAHEAALAVNGKTIAVLGSGVNNDSIYPRANFNLAQRIINNGGAVISELPSFSLPLKHHFPLRNRIISGLSLGTAIMEAGEKSGTLITAYSAIDQGRTVFAVPGSIFSQESRGTNTIIKKGAILITSGNDILEEFKICIREEVAQEYVSENNEEKNILSQLSRKPRHVNEVILLSKLPAHLVSGVLSLLEIKGVVKNLGGMMYVLK